MRLIERVLCELLRVVPDLLCDLKRVPVLDRAVVPVLLQHAHDVELLLAHCLAQLVCLAGGKAAHDHGHLHDLLLVHHGAVGFLKHRAQAFVVIMHGRLAACHFDIVVNHAGLQRARTIQGDRSNDVAEPLRWQACEQAHVQAALNLEQAVHVARTHKRKCRLIVGGNLLGDDLATRGHLHVATRARKHAQRAQAKEVHLQQAQVRRVMAVILRDDAAALGITLDRHVIGHRVSADDGCARMHALAAHVALDGLRRVYDRLDILFGVVGLLQIGVRVQRLLNGDAQLVADHLADLVAYAVGIVEHARRIAHGVFRLQLAERDNARNVIGAVHLANMLDDLLTTFILEVAVDIGHLNAFRGKESLEQQAVGKRLQVGNTHGICNDRTGSRTTAWSNTDALASRPVQVFLHNQEVRREALLDDDAHLIFGTIERLFGNGIAVALLHAFEHLMTEPALVRLALGKRELRQNGIALKDDVALLGNLHRGIACLGEIAKRLAHLLFGFHIELVVLELHAIRVVDGRARADAQHDILRLRVFLQQVVEVVRCDGLQARTVSNLGKLVI